MFLAQSADGKGVFKYIKLDFSTTMPCLKMSVIFVARTAQNSIKNLLFFKIYISFLILIFMDFSQDKM